MPGITSRRATLRFTPSMLTLALARELPVILKISASPGTRRPGGSRSKRSIAGAAVAGACALAVAGKNIGGRNRAAAIIRSIERWYLMSALFALAAAMYVRGTA